MANWFLDYLEEQQKRTKPLTPLSKWDTAYATGQPPPPPEMRAAPAQPPSKPVAPPPMPGRVAVDRVGEQAAAGLLSPFLGVAKGVEDLTGARLPLMGTAERVYGDLTAAPVDYSPDLVQRGLMSMGRTAGTMLPTLGGGAMGPLAQRLLGAPWWAAASYPEQRRDLDPLKAAGAAATEGAIEVMMPSPVPFLPASGTAGYPRRVAGEMGEEMLQAASDKLWRGQQPTAMDMMQTAKEAALPIAAMSALGMGGQVSRETAQPELPLTGGRRTFTEAARPAVTSKVAAHKHNRTIGKPEGTGSTTDIRTGTSPKTGFAVGVHPEATMKIPGAEIPPEAAEDFIRRNQELFRNDPGLQFGTWFNSKQKNPGYGDDMTYIDAVAIIPDLDTAMQVAKNNGELAIWDLKNKQEIPVVQMTGEQLDLQFEAPGTLFAQQTPNWTEYHVPGLGAVGVQSSQPGGHHVTIAPAKGKWVVENFGGTVAKAPTLEEAQARAEQFIANLPTPSAQHTAEAEAAQARFPGSAPVVEPQAPVQAPQAAPVQQPRPQPQRAPQPAMSEQEQRIAEQLRRAGAVAQQKVQDSLPIEFEGPKVAPEDMVPTLTAVPGGAARFGFPVWDFIENHVTLPSDKFGEHITVPGPGGINELMSIAYETAPLGLSPDAFPKVMEPRAAIRYLKQTDPDYLNTLLSRAVSAYYGDTTAAAMLQMEESGADSRTKALVEDINLAVERSIYRQPKGNQAVNVSDYGQRTVAPMGEVPPLMTYPGQEELALQADDRYAEMIEEARTEQAQQRFPEEVMNTPQDAFINDALERGGKTTGMWRIYGLDGKPYPGEGYYSSEKQANERLERLNRELVGSERPQARAFAAPEYAIPGVRQTHDLTYRGRGTGWSGRMGNRQITDESVRKFFAGERSWKKENMAVRSTDKWIEMRLHGNLIARYDRANGDLELYDGGWESVTTKERLNGILDAIRYPGRIYQRQFRWYYEDEAGNTKAWDGSMLIKGVTRGDTGTFAMQQPNELLPAFNALNTAEPRPVQPIPPTQLPLPGIGASTREVKISGVSMPVFTQGTSSLTGKMVEYPPGPVFKLTPNKGLYEDPRRQAAHDLIAKALDWAKDRGLDVIAVPRKFGEQYAPELQYESFHRGMGAIANPFDENSMLLSTVVSSQHPWGEQTINEERERATRMPPEAGVSDDFFRQTRRKFDIPTVSALQGIGQYGEVLGHGLRPFAQPERLRVMEMLESLERMGLPPLLVNRLNAIGNGAFSSPGNLAQVDVANDTLSVSEESIAQMMRGEAVPEVVQSVAHELGHLASIVVDQKGEPTSYLLRSPLFRWDPRSAAMYAQTGQAPQSAFGSVMKEVMDVGLKGEGVLGPMMAYPVLTPDLYTRPDPLAFKAEAFAQLWSAYYVMPEAMAEEMPLSYNLMRELAGYANTSKTFDQWLDRLRVGLQTAVNEPKLRKKMLDREVVRPFQASFFHMNVGGTDVEPVMRTANLTPEEQGFFERYVRGNEEQILDARRGVKNAQAIDAEAATYVRELHDLAKHLDMTLPDLMKKRGGIAMSSAELMAGKGLMSEAVRQTQAAAQAAMMSNADEGTVAEFVESFKGLQIITDEFFRARAEWGRAGQVLQRQAVDFAEAMQLVSKAGGMTSAKDLAMMVATLDPNQQAAFAQAAKKKTFGNKLWGIWYSFMLSNPKTHIVNFTSNAAYNQWLGLDRLVAAGIGKLHGGDKVYFKEMVPTLHGLAQGTLDAINHSAEYLRTGGDQGKWDIPGAEAEKLGVTNIVTRLMGTGDAFFHSVAFHQELRRLALRTAITEGHKGDALYQREEYIRTHPDEFKDIFRRAERYARKATFTEELTPWFKHLERLRGEKTAPIASGLSRMTVPFLRTIVNLTKQGARHTPGLSAAVPSWRRDIAAGGAARDIAVAENLTGAGLITLGWLLAEMGLGSGAEPPDPQEAGAWRIENQPVSIRMGDQWVGLNRIDPLASLYGIGASIPMIAESEDKVGAALEVAKELMLSKTWMTGLADAFGSMQSYSPEEGEAKIYRWLGGMASTTVPAILGEAARDIDPYVRKQQAEGPEGRFMGRVPYLREQLAPSVNVRGDLIERQQFAGPDFISPFPTKQIPETPDPVLAEMLRVHAVPANLKGTVKTGKLDTHTQTLYQQTARQIAFPILENLIYSEEYIDAPPDEQKDMIQKVLTKANAQARKEMFE